MAHNKPRHYSVSVRVCINISNVTVLISCIIQICWLAIFSSFLVHAVLLICTEEIQCYICRLWLPLRLAHCFQPSVWKTFARNCLVIQLYIIILLPTFHMGWIESLYWQQTAVFYVMRFGLY
jgi:hypothetical protein